MRTVMTKSRTWTDEHTGRTIYQLTQSTGGATVGYFRCPRYLPGGFVLGHESGEDGSKRRATLLAIHIESGEALPVLDRRSSVLRVRERDGVAWFTHGRSWRRHDAATDEQPDRGVYEVKLPGEVEDARQVGELPDEPRGYLSDITNDGRTLIYVDSVQPDASQYPAPSDGKVETFWHYFSRPRSCKLWAYDLVDKAWTQLAEVDGHCLAHTDTCPGDAGLLKFSEDRFEAEAQRIWTVRTDGSGLRKIRPQQPGEMVMHEWWHKGGEAIGFKYLDRRADATLRDKPWGEYAPVPLHLGLADLEGNQIYLSDPMPHYQIHMLTSDDGRWVSGEGTDGHLFVQAAPFDISRTRIDLQPLATIHSQVLPFSGAGINNSFTPDGEWIVYNDTIDGRKQVCAVRTVE